MNINKPLIFKITILICVVSLAVFFIAGQPGPAKAQVLPDLRVLSVTPPAEGTIFAGYPINGEGVTIKIENIGADYTGEYEVRIILRDFVTNGEVCSTVVSGDVPASEATHDLVIGFNDFIHCPALTAQTYYLDVAVDIDNIVIELTELNNTDISNSFNILPAGAAGMPKITDIKTVYQTPTKMQIAFKLEGAGSPVVYHETDADYIENEIYSESVNAVSSGSGWYKADLTVIEKSTNHYRISVKNTNVATEDLKFTIAGLVFKAWGDGQYQLEIGDTIKLDNNNFVTYSAIDKNKFPATVQFNVFSEGEAISVTTDPLTKRETYYEIFAEGSTNTILAVIRVKDIAPTASQSYTIVDLLSEGVKNPYKDLLSSYWSFDEGEGQIVGDSGTGNLNGALGSVTTTIESVDPSWRSGVDCISGSCLYFDGKDDYVNLGFNNYIHNNPESFSISLWAKGFGYQDSSHHGRGAWFGWTGDIPERGMLFGPNDQNDVHFSVPLSTNLAATVVLDDAQDKDRWEHWAAVYDAPSRLMMVYRNGQLIGRIIAAQGVPRAIYTGGIHTVKIGDRGDGQVNFNGFIDEVHYRNAVMWPDEIKAEYDKNAPVNPTPDLFYLRFNGNLLDTSNRSPQQIGQQEFVKYSSGYSGQGASFDSFGAYAQFQCSGIIDDKNGTLQAAVRLDEFSEFDKAVWQTDNSLFALYYDNASDNPAIDRAFKARAGGAGNELTYIIQEAGQASKWPKRSWHLADLTWEVSTPAGGAPAGIMKYYMDGELVGEASFSGYVGCETFRLGNEYGPGKNWDQGVIDEFKIYKKVLTAEEIKLAYGSFSMNMPVINNTPVISPSTDDDISRLQDRARLLREDRLDDLLAELNQSRDIAREQEYRERYLESLLSGLIMDESAIEDINHFITYGIDANTQKLGAGERAAVIHSFKAAFGKLPQTEDELIDAFKIANGRWPSLRNSAAEDRAKTQFKRIYLRDANPFNPNDNAAITVMAYGLRQKAENRNLDSERQGIKTFEYIYGKVPNLTNEWNTMQAITYSGAAREVKDADNDGLSDSLEAQYGTDANNPDTDGDSYLDGQEVVAGFSPL